MSYKLRFVQHFDKRDSKAFLTLEMKFIELERNAPDLASGSRYIPVMGREPGNTLVWEAEFGTMEAAMAALKALEDDAGHDVLLDEQIVYMRDAYVELYRKL